MKLPASHTVIGFHGTSAEAAERVLASGRFDESADGWLGRGIYFWEDAPAQALWWAKDQKQVVGRRAWDGSRLVVNAHIQLCVRDPRCIVGTWPVAVTDDGGWHWKAL